METAFCWLAHAWFYQWFYHFNRKVNVVTMVTSAKRQYFYFRSKIWRHHRLLGLDGQEVRNASSCQISSKSVKTRPSYDNFKFFKMAAAAILDFWNLKFLTVETLNRVELLHHAKFHRNCSNRGWDMAIFRFSRWRPPQSWICKISNF